MYFPSNTYSLKRKCKVRSPKSTRLYHRTSPLEPHSWKPAVWGILMLPMPVLWILTPLILIVMLQTPILILLMPNLLLMLILQMGAGRVPLCGLNKMMQFYRKLWKSTKIIGRCSINHPTSDFRFPISYVYGFFRSPLAYFLLPMARPGGMCGAIE